MIILGIDPGSQRFGVCLLEKEAKRASCLKSATIQLKSDNLMHRMIDLVEKLDSLFDEYVVNEAAIEEGYLGKNVKSVDTLSKIRGLVMALLIKRKIPLYGYAPRTVKLAVTGYGHADKQQIRKALSFLLGPQVLALADDESDALAVAYCHFLKG